MRTVLQELDRAREAFDQAGKALFLGGLEADVFGAWQTPVAALDRFDAALMHVKAVLEDSGLQDELPADVQKFAYVRALLDS
jgi:hypothetical protein